MELIESTALSADCPANLTQSQDLETAIKTLAHYIPTISDCFAQLDLDGQWLKMSQDYCQLTTDGLYEEYLAPLPPTGMMQSGNLYHAPRLVDAIKESDCLLLPTPKHRDKNTAGVKSHKKGQQKHLSVGVKELIPDEENSYLNSVFVEEIMGFPRYWTDLHFPTESLLVSKLLMRNNLSDRLDTALIPNNNKSNRKRLGQLGNAIVPQVGAIMFDLLSTIVDKSKVASRKSKVLRSTVRSDLRSMLIKPVETLASPRSVLPKVTCDSRLATFDLLSDLEQIIDSESSGIVSFDKVGNALLKIQTEKLYQQKGYSSFLAYCYDHFEISKARIYQLINAAKTLKLMSTIVDTQDQQLTESHCRELAKIKNLEERSLVLKKVISEGTVTAKAISATYKAMKLKTAAERNQSDLPSIGTIVRLTTKTHHDYQKYNGYWGIVTDVNEFSVAIQVINDLLPNVQPYSFLVIGKVEGVIELANRLSEIEKLPNINDTVRQIIKAIATRPYPCLDKIDEALLNTIEQVI